MKKIYNALFSTRLMGVLFIVFATAMGVSTFIENDFGTQTAKALVYNAWWFELIIILFLISFIGNIKKYNLWRKQKLSVLMFHLSFVIIIIGAGITRYISYEGMMPIYEGESTNLMLSDKAYFNVHIDDNKEQKKPINEHYFFANIPNNPSNFIGYITVFLDKIRGGNSFNIKTDFKEKKVSINYINYIPNAYEVLQENETGDQFLKIVESSDGSRHEHYVKAGETINMHGTLISFENPTETAVNIFTENDTLRISSPYQGNYMIMASRSKGEVVKDSVQTFHLRSLYQLGSMQFVIPDPGITGKMEIVSGDKDEHPSDLLEVEVITENTTKNVALYGNALSINAPIIFSQDGLNFRLSYGSNQIELPFSIKLRDFQLERHPGSMSPKSFASEITVIDRNKTFDFRIYMNNILDYKGYRFFQSGYNDTDEVEQTHLSVNHDNIGTWVTYIGYTLLFLGLILSLISNKTHFALLRRNLKRLKKKRINFIIIILLTSFTAFSQSEHNHHNKSIDSLITSQKIDKEHAKRFGELVIQDAEGRMKPVNTYATELLRKVSHNETYKDFDANQFVLSLMINPRAWFFIPFIYIKKDNTKLRDVIGVPHNQKYVSFSNLFTDKGEYKLKEDVSKAHQQKIKNKYEQSIIAVDERANLIFGAGTLESEIFKFFPLKSSNNNKWYAYHETARAGFKGTDSLYVSSIIPLYAQEIKEALKTKDYTKADEFLESIHKYQRKFGAEVIPSKKKVDLELFYNKYDIFRGLFWKYMLISAVLFILVIINILKQSKILKALIKASVIILILLFAYHTVGLGIRWYISGHAPWSNGYESI
ncbi:MAG: cytochrome c biogenesis protein ResB, partial [Flavobacteriaceae bacterium]|nr:cytochrome c biogenesis protein ResB [Flavobacteriaceae bacterium]